VWFRNRGVDIPQLGAGFGLSRVTAYRYHDEVLAVLAAQAPDLTEALQRVEAEGWSHVILDGKVVDSDRCAQKSSYSPWVDGVATGRGWSRVVATVRW
jgi:hypothetical protein